MSGAGFSALDRWLPVLFLGPTIVLLAILTIFPFIYSLNLSLHRVNFAGLAPHRPWVGLGNYLKILSDSNAGNALLVTGHLLILALPPELVLGFGCALLLYRKTRGMRLIRSLVTLPMAIMPIAAGLMFKLMYNPEFGVLGYILRELNLVTVPILGDANTALTAIAVTDIWQWTPYVALIFLAGLQAVPVDLLEVAAVDGASQIQTMYYITLPMLRPLVLLVLLFRTMDLIKAFDLPYLLTFGGPGTATNVYSLEIYRVAFRIWEMGYAAANSFVLLILVTILANILIRVLPTS